MKRTAIAAAICFTAFLSLNAAPAQAQSPQPAKRVDIAKFYHGTWLEIGRRPMWLTDGCVAGSTSYQQAPGKIIVKDACRKGTRSGEEKSIVGDGTILDPGQNAKISVKYNFLITQEYWIIDHADDYSWFIETSPDFKDLWIFTRKVPSRALLDQLVGRARAFGYDTSKLEFPPAPPM